MATVSQATITYNIVKSVTYLVEFTASVKRTWPRKFSPKRKFDKDILPVLLPLRRGICPSAANTGNHVFFLASATLTFLKVRMGDVAVFQLVNIDLCGDTHLPY